MGKLIQYATKASLFDGEWHWQAAGMGYVIVTENGHLIVIDGGNGEDAEAFLELLEESAGAAGRSSGLGSELDPDCEAAAASLEKRKPQIDLWILTHPHDDHFTAAWEISQDPALAARITVGAFCYSMPEKLPWKSKGGTLDADQDLARVFSLAPSFGCPVITPETGDVLEVDGTKIRFYFTWKDMSTLDDPNELSMAFTITGAKKRVMFTGDAYERGLLTALQNKKNDDFVCDMVQVAHHGLNGGQIDFYDAVKADIALVPISHAGDRAMQAPGETCCRHNKFAQEIAGTVIKAWTGTVVLDF